MNAPPISATPPRGPNRIVVAIAFVAGALCGLWLLFDIQDPHERGEAALRWLDESIDVRRQRSANLDAYAQEVAAVRKDLAMLEQRLPAQFATAEIEAGLRALTSRHGVELMRIVSGTERARDFYASMDYALELRGGTAALQAFFRDYSEIVPIRRLTRVRLSTSGAQGDSLMAEVRSDYYRFIDERETRR